MCPACASVIKTFVFSSLNELVLDQNLLSVLPPSLWDLKLLQTLKVARNRLALPPDKPPDMRALILAVSTKVFQKNFHKKTGFKESELKPENHNKNGLTTLNLRSNRLKGNIILGNYGVSDAITLALPKPVCANITELNGT